MQVRLPKLKTEDDEAAVNHNLNIDVNNLIVILFSNLISFYYSFYKTN